MRFVLFAALALFAVPALLPAAAQDASLSKVYACADIKDGAQRLACYDAAVASFRQAEEGGNVAVVSKEQIQQVEKDAFGLEVPAANVLAAKTLTPKNEKRQPLEHLSLPVKSVQPQRDGTLVFVMENGQVWKQIDTMKIARTGDGPWTAEIKKAAMGTFMLKLDKLTAVRVERVK